MMNFKYVNFLLIFGVLAGCSSVGGSTHDLSAEEKVLYKNMKEVSLLEKATIVGSVNGNSCFRGVNKKLENKKGNTLETATLQKNAAQKSLRINAVRMGADALFNEKCSVAGVDWVNHCWSSTNCVATAVRLD